jgi:flavin reductase (DIM6/NTAB) family NADH-FMN oxidoreductase RutF
MGIDGGSFRAAMGHFATGVTVVTTLDGDRPAGITLSALASVSLDPPLVLVALDRRRTLVPAIRSIGAYAVNILAGDQQALSDCFARSAAAVAAGADREAFCGADWHPGVRGVPVLAGTVASLECEVVEELSVGDHVLFVGRVVALGQARADDASALVYFRRRYVALERGPDVAAAVVSASTDPGAAPDPARRP